MLVAPNQLMPINRNHAITAAGESEMIKSLSRAAAVVLSGSSLALAAAMLPADAAAAPGWRAAAVVSVPGDETLLSGVAAVSARDGWAVGYAAKSNGKKPAGLVEHWDGRSWQRVSLPARVEKKWSAGSPFQVIGASSSTNVWAFDELGGAKPGAMFLRLNGRRWTTGILPGTGAGGLVTVTAVQVLGKSDAWVFGGKLKATTKQVSFVPYAAHFNGRRWTVVGVPGSSEITAVSSVSALNIWAVTGSGGLSGAGSAAGTPTVLHWNGYSWQRAAVQPASLPAGSNLTSITTGHGNGVVIGGDVPTASGGTKTDFTDQFKGSSWTSPADLPGSASKGSALPNEVESLVPDGSGGLWALGGSLAGSASKLWHDTGGKWSAAISPRFGASNRELLELAAVPGTRTVWGVGVAERGSRAEGLIAVTGPTPR
jgi:hypothetical protein